MSRFPDKLFDDNECRNCGEMSDRKYFCSDKHAIEFAMRFADVGYTFKHGKPQPHWTYLKPKDEE